MAAPDILDETSGNLTRPDGVDRAMHRPAHARALAFAAALACVAALALVAATPLPAHAQSRCASTGSPHDGALTDGGAELPLTGTGYHFETNRRNPTAHYGTPSLVAAIARAAERVARAHPGSDVTVSDVALPGGGPIRGHASHRSGRDADIGYYARDAAGAIRAVPPFTAFDARGVGRDPRTGDPVRFDAERTWAFMAALFTDPTITVRRVFIHPALRALLLAHARAHGAPRALIARAADALRPPNRAGADPHDDHFHVRIACPPGDAARGCRE